MLLAESPLCLGATTAGTAVLPAGQLFLAGNISVPEPITLQGILHNFDGTNTLTGDMTLLASNSFVQVLNNSALTLSNVMSGPGGITMEGPGPLTLAGSLSYLAS